MRQIGEQRQTNGSQRHRDGSAQNPADPTSKSAVSPAEATCNRKEEERKNVVSMNVVSIGRRVVLLLAAALIVATMAMMSAGPASADERSDSELRHRINEIQNNPGPVTNKERNKIQDLRGQIDDNDDDDDDDDDNDDD